MIRFNIYMGKDTIDNFELVNLLKDSPTTQPELSSYIYYGLGKLQQTDFYITNKFIKKVLFLLIIRFMN